MSDHTLAPLLREHPFLRGFTRDHIDFMVSCASNVRFKEGEVSGFLQKPYRMGDLASALRSALGAPPDA